MDGEKTLKEIVDNCLDGSVNQELVNARGRSYCNIPLRADIQCLYRRNILVADRQTGYHYGCGRKEKNDGKENK